MNAESNAALDQSMGLVQSQEIVDIDVPSRHSGDLHSHIMRVLSEKPAHLIVSMTMTAYGQYPTDFRVLIVIQYV